MDSFVELRGKFCPFPVVNVITEVEQMRPGQKRIFCVDDPLAIKSIPEELGEYDDLGISIERQQEGWKINISRT